MSSKAGSVPCPHSQSFGLQPLPFTWNPCEGSKKWLAFPRPQSSSSWAAQGSCAMDFQRRGLALGIASAIDIRIVAIWTEPGFKTFSGVLCLLWHPLQNEYDQLERVQGQCAKNLRYVEKCASQRQS